MNLIELFDNVAPYDISTYDGGIAGEFSIGDDKYTVVFSLAYPVSRQGKAAYDDLPDMSIRDSLKQLPSYDVSFFVGDRPDEEYDITGGGNEYVVFATILGIMGDVIQTTHPVELHFSSYDKSRTKLYNRMINVLSSKYGYVSVRVDSTSTPGWENYGWTKYALVRKDLV